MCKSSERLLKEKVFHISSLVGGNEQKFLKTQLSALGDMVDFSLIKEECSFVNNECWLAGGSLLRTLSRDKAVSDHRAYDRDFFFPTRQALVKVFETMLRNNCDIVCFNFFKRKLIHRMAVTAEEIGCLGKSAEEVIADKKVVKLLRQNDLVTVELLSPKGVRYQLIAGFNGNDPVEIISQFDYTICQFAVDGEYLYSGVDAWKDLLKRRLCYTDKTTNLRTAWRLYKFMKMGYRPSFQSALMAMRSIILSPFYIGR